MIARSVVLVDGRAVPGADQDGRVNTRVSTSEHVAEHVANHPGTGEVEIQLGCRPDEHAGAWLAVGVVDVDLLIFVETGGPL